MENAKKFFEETIKTEEAKVLLAEVAKTETEEDRIAAFVDVAAKLGVALSTDEIKAYYASSYTSDAQEIDDKELEQLSGGGASIACNYSYIKDENCVFADVCNHLWQGYDGKEEMLESRNQKVWDDMTIKHFPKCQHQAVNIKYNEQMEAINKK